MEFGWINLFGGLIVVIMLIPNGIYAVKNKHTENRCKNPAMNWVEQVGRYACLTLMWLPLLVWKFGFSSVAGMLLYLLGNGALLLAYLTVWAFYFRKPTRGKALALAGIPTAIFLLSGLILRHWLLVLAAIAFGIGHISVTARNNP